jgi:hypothetical protein
LTKRALDAAWGNDLDTQLDLERDLQREASRSPNYARRRARVPRQASTALYRRQTLTGGMTDPPK